MLEWVAISYFRGSSQLRVQTHVSYVPCIGRQIPFRYHIPGHYLGSPSWLVTLCWFMLQNIVTCYFYAFQNVRQDKSTCNLSLYRVANYCCLYSPYCPFHAMTHLFCSWKSVSLNSLHHLFLSLPSSLALIWLFPFLCLCFFFIIFVHLFWFLNSTHK